MLILGGVIGFALCFVLVGSPLAAVMATQLGLPMTIPVLGWLLAPVSTVSIALIAVVHFVLVCVFYLIARAAVRTNIPSGASNLSPGPLPASTIGAPPAPWQRSEHIARGALIGQNACFTMMLTWTLLPWLFQWVPVGGTLLLLSSNLLGLAGVIIGIANLMALGEAVCANRNFAAFMGWTSWIAAGSTLVNLLGAFFWFLSVVGTWLGFRLRSVRLEWWTGSFVVHGGPMFLTTLPPSWVSALGLPPAIPTAYNLGAFLFVDGHLDATAPSLFRQSNGSMLIQGSTAIGVTFHETAHTLALAAFGSWFHAIGAIDENGLTPAIPGTGENSYAELLAEGHLRDSTRPWFPLWTPPNGPIGATSNVPPTAGAATVNGVPPNAAPASIVVSAGSTLVLAAAGAADPDMFPQGVVAPGATPAVGVLWDFYVRPNGSAAVVADTLNENTSAAIDIGGDYSLAFALTDGIQLAGGNDSVTLGGGFAGAAEFGVSAVQAVITDNSGTTVSDTQFTAGLGSNIQLSAASSAAGSAGVAVANGTPTPLLIFAWTWATNGAGTLTLTSGGPPELIDVQCNSSGIFTVTLTATEQHTGTNVSHSTHTTIHV